MRGLQGEAGELDAVNLAILPGKLAFVVISLHPDCARGGVQPSLGIHLLVHV